MSFYFLIRVFCLKVNLYKTDFIILQNSFCLFFAHSLSAILNLYIHPIVHSSIASNKYNAIIISVHVECIRYMHIMCKIVYVYFLCARFISNGKTSN